MVEKNCLVCGVKFTGKPKRKYCSNYCKGRSMDTSPEPVIALWLEGLSAHSISKRLKLGYHTVERILKRSDLFEPRYAKPNLGKHTGRPSLNNYRDQTAFPSSYRETAFAAHGARCSVCGYDKYTSVLEVHHRDSDRTNCAAENLAVLCPTHHAELHYEQKSGPWYVRKAKSS